MTTIPPPPTLVRLLLLALSLSLLATVWCLAPGHAAVPLGTLALVGVLLVWALRGGPPAGPGETGGEPESPAPRLWRAA